MKRLWESLDYKPLLESWDRAQEVMLGYSELQQRQGHADQHVELHKAQRDLHRAAREPRQLTHCFTGEVERWGAEAVRRTRHGRRRPPRRFFW